MTKPKTLRLARIAYKLGMLSANIVHDYSERGPLPEGFVWAKTTSITHPELASLEKKSFRADQHYAGVRSRKPFSRLAAGVRNQNGELIATAQISYRGRHGEFGSLMVDPDYRGEGLGRALVEERLALAETAGIESIYIPFLEDTNPMEAVYLEHGFRITDRGEFVRGPDPQPIHNWDPVIDARLSSHAAVHAKHLAS